MIPLVFLFLLGSCTITNNLYVNNSNPLPKNSYELYGGIGMGFTPRIDSVSDVGEVFSHRLYRSYNLVVGGRYGITDHFDISGSINFPQIIGGAGLTLRPQISLLPPESGFNIGLAADFGGVLSKDSLKILGSSTPLDNETRGSLNADFSLPLSVKLGNGYWLFVTPRYSFNTFYLRREFEMERSKRMNIEYPALTLGLKLKRVHLEATGYYMKNYYNALFGVVYFFNTE